MKNEISKFFPEKPLLPEEKEKEKPFDVVVVFGQGPVLKETVGHRFVILGRMNLDAAAWLYQNGRVRRIICTGGKTGGEELESEAERMAKILKERYNIPENDIIMETKARNTIENFSQIANIIDKNPEAFKNILFLSSSHHLNRIKELSDLVGIKGKYMSAEEVLISKNPEKYKTIFKRLAEFPNIRQRYLETKAAETRWLRGLKEIPEYWLPCIAKVENLERFRKILQQERLKNWLKEKFDIENIQTVDQKRLKEIRQILLITERIIPPKEWAEGTLRRLSLVKKAEIFETYHESDFLDMLVEQKTKEKPMVLVADIDQTMYYLGEEATALELAKILEKNKIPLVYVTGRDLQRVEEDKNIPKANLVIGAVGTELFVRNKQGKMVLDENFRKILLESGWDRQKVYQKAQKVIKEIAGLEFQERDRPQSTLPPQEFKISLNFQGDPKEIGLKEKLEVAFPDEGIVISKNFRFEDRYFVDLLPKVENKTGKVLALDYLKRIFDVHLVMAGDSGNDLDMLQSELGDSILVGNAQPDAKESIKANIESFISKNIARLKSGGIIYLGSDQEPGPKALIRALLNKEFNKLVEL